MARVWLLGLINNIVNSLPCTLSLPDGRRVTVEKVVVPMAGLVLCLNELGVDVNHVVALLPRQLGAAKRVIVEKEVRQTCNRIGCTVEHLVVDISGPYASLEVVNKAVERIDHAKRLVIDASGRLWGGVPIMAVLWPYLLQRLTDVTLSIEGIYELAKRRNELVYFDVMSSYEVGLALEATYRAATCAETSLLRELLDRAGVWPPVSAGVVKEVERIRTSVSRLDFERALEGATRLVELLANARKSHPILGLLAAKLDMPAKTEKKCIMLWLVQRLFLEGYTVEALLATKKYGLDLSGLVDKALEKVLSGEKLPGALLRKLANEVGELLRNCT